MKAIKFSEKELEFLREQYQDELSQAKEYVNQILEILKKLGVREKSVKEEPVEIKVYKKRGPKPKVKTVESKVEPKKRGRKPKITIPTLEIVPESKPEKNEGKKKVSKAKVGRKKKLTENVVPTPVKEVKVAPKKDVKKVAKKKPEKKSPVKIETTPKTAPVKEVKEVSKKKVKKAPKTKSLEKKRIDEMAKSAKLTKPIAKKETVVEPVTSIVEPIIPTVEETKE